MMHVLDFVAVAFASGAVLDAWANGSIFDALRDYVRRRADGEIGPPSVPPGELPEGVEIVYPIWAKILDRVVPRFFMLAWDCLFCASYHAAAYLLLVFYVPSVFLPHPWSVLVKLPIYSLAATRVANLLSQTVGLSGLHMFKQEQEQESDERLSRTDNA